MIAARRRVRNRLSILNCLAFGLPRFFCFFARLNRKAGFMAVIVIFVEGANTKPDPLPIYFLDNDEHATLICEGLKESEYRSFNFTIKRCTRADRGRFAVWAKMVIDARDGVYGCIAAGIYNMIDEARAIISQRRAAQEPVAKAYGSTESDGDTVVPPAKQESQVEINDNHPKGDELPPPKYDPNSADWILSETLCDVINIKAATIAKYRRPRNCGEDKKDEFGRWNVDCVGKFRRNVTHKRSVAYYRPAMSSLYQAKLEYAESQKRQKP
jgi:hypothetical protein